MAGFRAFKGSGQRLNGKMADSPSVYGSSALHGMSSLSGPLVANGSAATSSQNINGTGLPNAGLLNGSAANASHLRPPLLRGGLAPAALHLPFGKLFFGYDTVIKTKADMDGSNQKVCMT